MRCHLTIASGLLALAAAVQAAPKVDRLRMPYSYLQKLAAVQEASSSFAVVNENDAAASNSSQIDPTFAPTVTAAKDNIFDSLTIEEAASVVKFCHEQDSLNLTAAANATSWDNQITVVDILMPNKTDALAYLDKNGDKPKRYAIVTISHGASEEPYIEDIGVGPLPVSDDTSILDLSWMSTKGKARVHKYNADEDAWQDFFNDVAAGVVDITEDLINCTVTGSDNDTASVWGIDPLWHRDGRVIQWLGFWGMVSSDYFGYDGSTLLPQGLYFRADTTGRDSSKWKVTGWLYNGQFFSTTKEFRAAWKEGTLEKAEQINSPVAADLKDAWYGTDRLGEAYPEDDKLPPAEVAPDGQRFKVDDERRYVEWMDFSFYFTFTRDTGLRLYDISYGGKRIIYELGLQEAVAHYAGNDPVQAGTSYLDTYYGFGPYAFELVKGYDCPAHATYFNATFHATEVSKTHRDAICLYEHDMAQPIQRHSSGEYVSVSKDIALVLKTVNTVGNYDYSFSYTFHLDGTIETKVSASGYIQSAYYAQNEDYGYQIRKGLSGSMHDHVLNFKADLDIGGTKNSVAKHAVVPVEKDYIWNDGLKRKTMQLERSYYDTETSHNFGGGTHSLLLVVNKDETDAFGQPLGYRLMPCAFSFPCLNLFFDLSDKRADKIPIPCPFISNRKRPLAHDQRQPQPDQHGPLCRGPRLFHQAKGHGATRGQQHELGRSVPPHRRLWQVPRRREHRPGGCCCLVQLGHDPRARPDRSAQYCPDQGEGKTYVAFFNIYNKTLTCICYRPKLR